MKNSVGVFLDFEKFPCTNKKEIPSTGNNTDWIYFTDQTNSQTVCREGTDRAAFCNSKTEESINFYTPLYNSDHMGWEQFGYLEISNFSTLSSGRSLKCTITGGRNINTCPDSNNCGAIGKKVKNKEEYLATPEAIDYQNEMKVGALYLYIMQREDKPIIEANEANRMSIIYHSPFISNGVGGSKGAVKRTFGLGPFNGVGGHWYHDYNLQNGGFAKILMEGHPNHNNAYSSSSHYPYPSKSVRNYGKEYFNTMYRFYIALYPYSGVAVPPYDTFIDKIDFYDDTEPQNDETINSLGVLYRPIETSTSNHSFEITLNDKYKSSIAFATFQLKYSFNQITNANWDKAKPVVVLNDTRFGIETRTDGKFAKWMTGYHNVWAPFQLQHEDENLITSGKVIYFAVKDISQNETNQMQPIDPIIDVWFHKSGGRDYENSGDQFDYEGDKNFLNLIKRIDFQIPYQSSIEKEKEPTTSNIEGYNPFITGLIIFLILFPLILLLSMFVGVILFLAFFRRKEKNDDIELSKQN